MTDKIQEELEKEIEEMDKLNKEWKKIKDLLYQHDPEIWTKANGDKIATKEDIKIWKELQIKADKLLEKTSYPKKLLLEAKLSQHLAIKTEMIKDEIEFLETEKEQLRIIIKQKNEIITDKIYTSDEKKEARQYAKYLIPHILETIKIYDERLAKLNAEKKELKT